MKVRKTFFKSINRVLASILFVLGFAGCEKGDETEILVEYGTPHANYTVKGAVVNKATGKPIEGIRVGFNSEPWVIAEYGVIPTSFQPKSNVHVLTDAKGEFKLTDSHFPNKNLTLDVYVDDIDGVENGLFQSDTLQVNFSDAKHSGKPGNWYQGEYTVTVNVGLNEVENQTDE
jgi:putative lipoprotein (rSAM/lipoprotein system)